MIRHDNNNNNNNNNNNTNNNNNNNDDNNNNNMTIMWDMPVNTDRTITANRPDIIVKDSVNSTCKLIETSH